MNGYIVTGPGCEGRKAPGYGPALSLAQALASRHATVGTWYVRPEFEGGTVAHVTREDDGSVTTIVPRVETAIRVRAEKQTLAQAARA